MMKLLVNYIIWPRVNYICMDHPQEEISQHITMLPDMLFEAKPFLTHHHYSPSTFKKVHQVRNDIYVQQIMIYCCSCRIILSKTLYISFEKRKCCIPCFSNIFIFPSGYEICNQIGSFLFDSRWTADQELQLLNAIEKLGYGNWNEIQTELGNKKKSSQIEEHYQLFYANHAESPYVSLINNQKLKICDKLMIVNNSEQQSEQLSRTQKRIALISLNLQKNTLKQRKMQNESFPYQKLIGYEQKRDDFQIQYDNQLELLISEMEFTQFDTQNTIEMKMSILQLFSLRIQKRYKIKDFVIHRRLLDLSELNHNEKKKKKQEKQLAALLKPFARFAQQEQMETLISGLLKQNLLRKQILKIKDKDNQKYQKLTTEKQSSRASSISTSLNEKNNKQHLKKSNNQQQKAQCWFLAKKEVYICKKYGIDFIAFTFIKETIRSINAIEGKINPEEYFYSIFRLTKEAIHQICLNIQQNLQTNKNIDKHYSK